MMRRPATLLIVCALLLTSTAALGRAPVVPPTASDLRAIVETLTTREMDGRRAGTPGGDRATERLAAWLGAAGLRPGGDSGTFLQSFTVAPGRRLGAGSALEVGGRTVKAGVDWTPHGGSRRGEVTGALAFADDDWSGDLRDKVVVATARGSRLETLILARQRGAAALLLVADPLPTLDATAAPVDIASGALTRAAAEALRAAPTGTTARLAVDLAPADLRAANVIGVLPGADPVLAGETIVLGAVDSGARLRAATADAARAAGVNADLRGTPFSPSDHTRFYAAGTPVLFLHTGGHDDYHRPGDTADKLNVDGMARVAAIGASIVTALDDGARPVYAKLTPPARRRGGTGSAAFLGVGGDGHGGDGAWLAHVMPGSAAERAGLRDGDVLVRVDSVSVDGFEALRTAIRARRPGDTVRLVYLRDGRDHETSATLERSQE